MTISEKVAYIKGLAEGMNLDTDKNEGKLLAAIIDALAEICDEIDALDDAQIELAEQLDAVDEDLSSLEEIIYEDDECDCCDCCDDDCDDYDDYDDYEDDLYEVTCPKCNDTIYIDAEMLEEGGIDCPNCGTDLEFDFDCDCEDCDCDECDIEEQFLNTATLVNFKCGLFFRSIYEQS